MPTSTLDLLIKMQADVASLKRASNEVRKLKNETFNFGNELKRGLAMGVGFGSIQTGAAAAAIAIKQVAKDAFQMNATIEQQRIAFATLLKSDEAAVEHVDVLKKLAARTPFQLEDFTNASKVLIAFGGAALGGEKGLRLVGDTAAALNPAKLEEFTRWFGRLYMSLTTGEPIGEPIQNLVQLGALTGDEIKNLRDLGGKALSTEKAFQVLTDIFGKNAGAMDRQSQSAFGLLSTMRDGFSLAAANRMQPYFEIVKAGISGVLKEFGVMNQELDDFTAKIDDKISSVSGGLDSATSQTIGKTREQLRALKKELQDQMDAKTKTSAAFEAPKPVYIPGVGMYQSGFNQVGSQAKEASREFEVLEERIKQVDEALRLAGDEEAFKGFKDRKTLEAGIEAMEKSLATTKAHPDSPYALGMIDRENMEKRLATYKTAIEEVGKIEKQAASEDFRGFLESMAALAQRLKEVDAERKTLFDGITEATEETKKKEFELLMTYDQQIVALNEKKATKESELTRALELAQTEDQTNAANLFYRTQIAEIEKQILETRQKQNEEQDNKVDTALTGFFGSIDSQAGEVALQNQKAADLTKREDEERLRRIQQYTDYIRRNFTAIISGAKTWREALADISDRTLGEMLTKIQDIFAAWIEGMIQKHILGQALQKQETASGVAAAGTQTAAWTPAAFLSSVASFGASLAAGALLMAAVAAISGGFAEGGYTGAGGKFEPAGIVHRGEFVIPKNIVEQVGVAQLYDFMSNAGRGYSSGGFAGPSIDFAPGSGSGNKNSISVIMVDDNRSDIRRAYESTEGRKAIMRTVRGQRKYFNF